MQSCPHVAILSFTVFPICFQQRMQTNIHFLQSTFLKVTAIFLFFTDFILNTFSFIRSAHNKSTRDSGPSFQIIIWSKSQLPVNLSLCFLLAFRYFWFSRLKSRLNKTACFYQVFYVSLMSTSQIKSFTIST